MMGRRGEFAASPPQWSPPPVPLTRGTIFRRIVAFVVDGIILVLLAAILHAVLVVFAVVTFGLAVPLFGLLPFLGLFYNWLTVASPLSATPGQALLGLVVRRDEDLGPPGALAALVWVLVFYLSLALSGLPLLLALFTRRRRTAHDIAAGLVVVRAQALTGAAPSWNMAGGGGPPFA
jgi:uncharacterized RDD family membrane protein YckC